MLEWSCRTEQPQQQQQQQLLNMLNFKLCPGNFQFTTRVESLRLFVPFFSDVECQIIFNTHAHLTLISVH